jgi:uncharacterized protein (TIGR02145 family)
MKNFIYLISFILLFSCKQVSDSSIQKYSKSDTLKTSKINIHTIKIGNQIWMTSNLNVSKFSNGDEIVEAKTAEEWKAANIGSRPAWCYYDYDSSNGVKYGKLYNWYAVYDKRGIVPEGFRIPNLSDWNTLQNKLGGRLIAGNKLKSNSEWIYREIDDTTHINETGFNAFPSGSRNFGGDFFPKYEYAFFWCYSPDSIVNCFILQSQSTFFSQCIFEDRLYSKIEEKHASRGRGMSIRCIKK